MGFRFGLIAADTPASALAGALVSHLGLELLASSDTDSVDLPGKLDPGCFICTANGDRAAIALPYQLLQQCDLDLAALSQAVEGELVGVGVEDTVGEIWYQRFDGGDLIAEYYHGDGIVVRSVGDHPRKDPIDWEDEDLFGLLPEWLHLDSSGALALAGVRYDYRERTPEPEPAGPWWKFW
ncbi:MAG: hypothetical protein AAFR91_12770 [Pseudomonadota bacterium]